MADGYLNFDTAINTRGFNAGVKTISKNFLGSAADMKAAFDMVYNAVNSVIGSYKQLTSAYQTQIEAEARLEQTMKNSTAATETQIQSVKDLASSLQEVGVVGDEIQLAGAQELATYVGTTESIKKMLPVLNDMVAQQYGFNASTDSAVTIATMLGKVLQGQTSALSRYGYSFDENQEKLLKYGTEEQRVATLAAVVEESVAGVNKALADTPTGKIKQLSNDFGDLKETAGELMTNIVYPIVTYLDVIIKKLNEALKTASTGLKSLFGISDNKVATGAGVAELEEASDAAAENYEKIAESAQKAEKANKGELAAFDELNVAKQPEEEATSPETIADTAEQTIETLQAMEDVANDVTFDAVESKVQKLFEFFAPVVEKVKTFIDTIKELFTSVGGAISEWWNEKGGPAFEKMKAAFEGVKKTLLDIWHSVFEPLFVYMAATFQDMWKKHLKPLWGNIGDFIAALMEFVAMLWTEILQPFYENWLKKFLVGVLGVGKSIWDFILDLFSTVVDVIGGVIKMLTGILKFITGIFTGDFEKSLEGLEDIVMGFCEVVWGLIRGAINMVIDALNAAWSALYGVLKTIVDGVGGFVAQIGELLGASGWGFQLPDEVPRIPRLAQGTVIPANYGEFAAILGDNTREREFVSPEGAMKQAFLEALAESGLIGGGAGGGDVVVNIDGYEVFRAVKKQADGYSRSHGGRSAFGGAY